MNRDGEIVLYFKVNTLKLNHFRGWTVHNGRLLELFTMLFVLVFYRVTHLFGYPPTSPQASSMTFFTANICHPKAFSILGFQQGR